jgi:hypothetical protein
MPNKYSISEEDLHRYLEIGTMVYEDEDRFAEACEMYGTDIPLAFLVALLRHKYDSWKEIVDELQYRQSTSSLTLNSDDIYKLKTACYLIENVGLLAFEPICDAINCKTAVALFIGITRNGSGDWHETISAIRNSNIFLKVP